jgi:uncharacterized peroxidase-related enzyme
MAHVRQVDESEATGLLANIYEAAVARAGAVANIIKVMSLEPRLLEAAMHMYVQLMKTPASLSRAQREMIATVVSNANDCFY